MEIVFRKPYLSEKEVFVNLSCELLKYSRRNNPKPHDIDISLNARRKRALKAFEEQSNRHVIFLAIYQNQPVGFIRGHLYEPNLAIDKSNHLMGHLDEIFIVEHLRGNSIGKKLIEKLNGWMKLREVKQMTLEMDSWNEKASGFYKKEGFEVVDVVFQRDVIPR